MQCKSRRSEGVGEGGSERAGTRSEQGTGPCESVREDGKEGDSRARSARSAAAWGRCVILTQLGRLWSRLMKEREREKERESGGGRVGGGRGERREGRRKSARGGEGGGERLELESASERDK